MKDLIIYLEEAAEFGKKVLVTLKDGTVEIGYPVSFFFDEGAEFEFDDDTGESGFYIPMDDIEEVEVIEHDHRRVG